MNAIDDYRERGKNDPRFTADLLEEAAAAAGCRDSADDVLSDAYWDPVRILHCRADDCVMAAAAKLLSSEVSAERILAADILAQVAFGNEARRLEAADALGPAFEKETDCDVLDAMACAFGHIGDERCVPCLVELSSHSDESLRHAVVLGLPGQDDPGAVSALIKLCSDPDDAVSDWATFGLGSQTEVDTPELRSALVARLHDMDHEARLEALVGPARRGDARIVPVLLKELGTCATELLQDWHLNLIEEAAKPAIQAALMNPDRNWCLLLEKLKALGMADAVELQRVLAACRNAQS